ncbi:MAG TPA: holo-ACP synthase [Thiobacillaceae bacterium]|nr:holo-ACP synthase [Thiobacillaceae bacterium]HNU64339.1 holo-ACP synthase [Thiobacillaceae bacterium]
MIHGIGTDIVSIQRMRRMHARFGQRLAERILAPQELADYAHASHRESFLAKRFAAKEAFAKAAGTGMRGPVRFAAIHLTHDVLGRPGLAWGPELSAWLTRQGIRAAHLSLSDEQDYALAFVVLEKT